MDGYVIGRCGCGVVEVDAIVAGRSVAGRHQVHQVAWVEDTLGFRARVALLASWRSRDSRVVSWCF
jgi:hypothetical protein